MVILLNKKEKLLIKLFMLKYFKVILYQCFIRYNPFNIYQTGIQNLDTMEHELQAFGKNNLILISPAFKERYVYYYCTGTLFQ